MEGTEVVGVHQQVLYVISGLLCILCTIGWFFIRGVMTNQKESDVKISLLEKDLAVNTADDKNHQNQFSEIKAWMVRIEEKLDKLKK